MPSLQLHMLRVAGVAKIICTNFIFKPQQDTITLSDSPHESDIISACLLHDMGNIIKFNLEYYPEFLEPEGYDYWQSVKEAYLDHYGTDEHKATVAIAKELDVSAKVLRLVKSFGFSQAPEHALSVEFDVKICSYADHRVGPFGIDPLEKKIQEGRARFSANKGVSVEDAKFEYYAKYIRELETQIFVNCSIKPEDINDRAVIPYIVKLEQFKI